MSTRTLSHGLWWWVVGLMSAAALWVITASVAGAGTKIHAATQASPTEIGPGDVPVRMAVFTSADRDQLKVEPVHWGWGRGYAVPYYSYYPSPYYYSAYYPAPYTAYYGVPYYSTYSYYGPTYFAARPYYSYFPRYYASYPAPLVTYRYPRRAFYGAWYW